MLAPTLSVYAYFIFILLYYLFSLFFWIFIYLFKSPPSVPSNILQNKRYIEKCCLLYGIGVGIVEYVKISRLFIILYIIYS
jgi:gamma-glutamylcysteine synthetase